MSSKVSAEAEEAARAAELAKVKEAAEAAEAAKAAEAARAAEEAAKQAASITESETVAAEETGDAGGSSGQVTQSNGRVLTRNMLLEKVWDMNFDPTTSVVETHISRLRAKIEKPFGDSVIRTMRGAGYIFEPTG